MSEALRSLLAEFIVQVDKAGELAKGNAQVDALKERLVELQAQFEKVKAPAERAGRAIRAALTPDDIVKNAIGAASAGVRNSEAVRNLTGGGSSGGDGFLGAGLSTGKVAQFGPTRETLNAANQAASDYSKTLKGRLAGAVQSVRKAFAGGAGGEGGGLIGSLTTLRTGLIGLGVGVTVHAVRRLVDAIGEIADGATRLGVTTDQFQRLSLLAKQSGTDISALGGAFRILASNAVTPSKDAAAAFAELGVSVKDGNGQFKTANDLFFDVSEALSGVTDDLKRSDLATRLLGRGAQQLKPIFSEGTAAFRAQRKELQAMAVLSPQTIQGAKRLGDTWAGLGPSFLAAAEPLLEQLIPGLQWLTDAFVKAIPIVRQFFTESKVFKNIAAVFTTLTLPIALVFRGLKYLVDLMGGKGTSTAAKFADVVGRIGLAWSSMLTFLPLLIDDFQTYLSGGDSLIGRAITSLEAAFGAAWDAIRDSAGRALDFVLEKAKAVGRAVLNAIVPEALQKYLLPVIGITPGGNAPSAPDTIPAPGGGGASGQYGPPPPPAITVGDKTVNITMGPSATAGDVGRAVGGELDRDTTSLIAAYGGF